jgi:hypothetical protein
MNPYDSDVPFIISHLATASDRITAFNLTMPVLSLVWLLRDQPAFVGFLLAIVRNPA